VSPTDSAPADPRQESSLAAAEDQVKKNLKAFGEFIERITPWLFDVGSWIFGGLIAFTLLVIASLLTVGPVDHAINISTAAFALALPLDVTGLFLLKLVQDLKQVGFEEELAQAFHEVGFTVGEQVLSPNALESMRKRRTRIVLGYCLGILVLGALLTLTGVIAALWNMAWWIGVAFFAMVMISLGIVMVVIATAQPPDSAEEKERRGRYRDEIIRRAKEQHQKKEVIT